MADACPRASHLSINRAVSCGSRAPVMQQVVAHVASSFRVHPRRIVVLYFRPECAWLFDEAHFLTRVASLTSRQRTVVAISTTAIPETLQRRWPEALIAIQ